MPEKPKEGDVEVDRFVEKVLLDMDDADFSEAQKIIILDLLYESILETE